MDSSSAVLIDNFLPQLTFNSISTKVVESHHYTNGKLGDYVRDALWDEVTNLVFARLKEIGLYSDSFEEDKKVTNFSYNQFRPSNYYHGYAPGPHIDNGSYVFYIHPDWDAGWGGKLKLPQANEQEYRDGIWARPNRFIWMNPNVLHDISTTSESATHARVTNLGFLNRCFDQNPVGIDYINISTTI